jgi:hypothetical protein
MTILNKLATALNRRDEVPNQELAQEIVKKNDKSAVKELVENLANKNKDIQNDCIKVLYEIGYSKPEMIASYHKEFAKLLDSKNNRMVWGAMTALDAIALNEPKAVFGLLSKILATADAGSVITRDHAFGILTKLGTLKQYSESCFPLMVEQLMSCPNNQFPMYAEKSLAMATDQNKDRLKKVLNARIENLEKESQKKRIAKVLKSLK